MTLCSDNHDEVCYEGRNCPACALYGETVTLMEKLDDSKSEIDQLKNEVETLKNP